ncbi:MAG: histidine phosphatase family protein [Aquabacterium sp.]
MIDLIVIRHGETDWNRRNCFQGQIDVPLNATGRSQALALAAALGSEPIDVVVSSDLSRAQETAAIATAALGQDIERDPRWREQHFGLLEGQELADVQATQPQLWAQWLRHDPDFALPGGAESVRAFHERVVGAVQALAQAHAGRRVALFTHGGVLDMLWRTAHGLPLAGPRECAIPNTGINRLRWDAGRLRVLQWAEATHLR